MSEYDTITSERAADERVAVVRLDAPERNNTIDEQLILEFSEPVVAADRDSDVQGIVVGANGEMFCAGADLNYLAELSFQRGTRFMTAYFEALDLLRETGKPVVAGVHGTCAAGGNELVSACDLIVAEESARFTQPEAGVGATAAGGGVQMLPLIIGEKRAKDLLLTGRAIDAEEAKAMGLINRVVPEGDGEARAVDLVQTIIDEKSPPGLPDDQGDHETVDELRPPGPGDGPRTERPRLGQRRVPRAGRGVPRSRGVRTAGLRRRPSAVTVE